ncbi:uncharacterized protein [Channa argus]|uniref:uncharacterized protein isoform X6 n=1 Tax=Channa argus TaxID=215402 RepID=UPI003521CDF6
MQKLQGGSGIPAVIGNRTFHNREYLCQRESGERRKMAEIGRIQTLLFVIPMLQFTDPVFGQFSYFLVNGGHDITLPCETVKVAQDKCNSTDWLYEALGSSKEVKLVKLGTISEEAKSKPDRLSVTEKCSLLIKKVTDEDVGLYTCKQILQVGKRRESTQIHLSLVTITERMDDKNVTLNCSVSSFGGRRYTVKWLCQGTDVETDSKYLVVSLTYWYTTVSLVESRVPSGSVLNSFTCEVTDRFTGKVNWFPSRPQQTGLLRLIIVSVGLLTLIIIVVAVDIWTRTKGKKSQMDKNTVSKKLSDLTKQSSICTTLISFFSVSWLGLWFREVPLSKALNSSCFPQLDEDKDKDEGTVKYENAGDSSASVRFH